MNSEKVKISKIITLIQKRKKIMREIGEIEHRKNVFKKLKEKYGKA